MQPRVPLVFHNLPSLYPPSFRRNLLYCFLVVPMHHRCKKEICIILAITVDTYLSCSIFFSLCSTRGSNSDPTVTTLRYQYSGHKPRIVHTTIVTLCARGQSRRGMLERKSDPTHKRSGSIIVAVIHPVHG